MDHLSCRAYAYTNSHTLPWLIPCPLRGPIIQKLGNSFSDGVFVPDEMWNVTYLHVLLSNASQGGEGTLTVSCDMR